MDMKLVFLVSAFSACVLTACGDVWSDCFALYMGGVDLDADGVFENGELKDLRHAADPGSVTHGGGVRTDNAGAAHLTATVVSAAGGTVFPGQRVIYLPQTDGVTSSGAYGVIEQSIRLPFSAVTNEYTVLLRMRMDVDQPRNKDFVSVLDLGYSGGTVRRSFYVRYYPEDECFSILCNNGSNNLVLPSPTNSVCTTLRGTWVEMAVSMNKGTMRLGVKAPGMDAFVWNSKSFDFPQGMDIPTDYIYVGRRGAYGGVSSMAFSARTSVHMVSYWERVLSEDEVEEAFSTGGLLDSASFSPAVLSVGNRDYGAEMFSGATTGIVTEVSSDLQDISAFPAGIEAGRTVRIPFFVPDTCTNLPQCVRLTASSGSAGGRFTVRIDGSDVKSVSVAPGRTQSCYASPGCFTGGLHHLDLVRIDGGDDPVSLSCVEISGSWRVGWMNNTHSDLGGDITTANGTKTYYVTQLSSNRWKTVRSAISAKRFVAVYADVDAVDAASRRFVFRTRPTSYPSATYDIVLYVNGVERFRRLCLSNDLIVRPSPVAVELPPGTLNAGENEFLVKTEENPGYPDPSSTWIRLDCYSLECGRDPVGTCIIVR